MAQSPNKNEETTTGATGEQNEGEIETVATSENGLLPHLETLERMMKLPVVEAAWIQSQDVYGKVKGELQLDYFIFGYHFIFNYKFKKILKILFTINNLNNKFYQLLFEI